MSERGRGCTKCWFSSHQAVNVSLKCDPLLEFMAQKRFEITQILMVFEFSKFDYFGIFENHPSRRAGVRWPARTT